MTHAVPVGQPDAADARALLLIYGGAVEARSAAEMAARAGISPNALRLRERRARARLRQRWAA